MKRITRNITPKHLIDCAFLFIASLAIWLDGPLITIGGQQPLQQTGTRFYIIVALFLIAVLKWIFFPPKKPMATTLSPELRNKLQKLQGRFEGAIQFLRKTQIFHRGERVRLSNLPWYLLIGPNGAGKTSLLANSTVNYTLTKQFKQERILPSDACDWWATRDLVIVDMPGAYLKPKNHILWNNFLNLIKQNRGIRGLTAIIVALPLPELMKKQNLPQKKQIAQEIKQKLHQLFERFGPETGVFFVITKCDEIPGFLDFFSECGTEELAQAWGITFPPRNLNENLLDIFTQRFNALIKKLNTQLISRMHYERNPLARPAIKDFPLQMERMKEMMGSFIKMLGMPNLCLHGMYLTSAAQFPQEDKNSQSQVINPSAHQSLQLMRSPVMPSKAFFLRQLITQGFLSLAEKQQPVVHNTWQRRFAYTAAIFAFVTAVMLLGKDFQQSILLTYAIQNDLRQYQISLQDGRDQEEEHFLKALPLLNSLQSRATDSATKFSRLAVYSDKSQKTAQAFYRQALQTIILPEIKHIFENHLKNTGHTPPDQLYSTLKAYLMLGNKEPLQADYVVAVLKQLIASPVTAKTNTDLIMHLNAALANSPTEISLNNNLISEVRTQLQSLPKIDLAFVVLRNIGNNNAASNITLGDPSIFIDDQQANPIINLFTADKFVSVLTKEIAFVATETLQGNSVLGTPQILSSEATINSFAQQIRTRYISNYVELWEKQLANIKLVEPSNLTQTDAMISSITSNTSPLLSLLKVIQQNTSFAPILSASTKLQTLNNLLANAHREKENNLYEIFVSLRKLHFQLEQLITANDTGAAAFETAKLRMANPTGDSIAMVHLLAEQNPEPMKSLLNNLASQSWRFILEEAGHHIENAWQVNVITIYNSQIANHYPIDPASNQEIDLQQFVGFAGKQGTFVNFYERYLKPFIASDANQWRVVDNLKLPFDNEAVAQLQQALKVQNISRYTLFTQGQTNPALAKFQLPESLQA